MSKLSYISYGWEETQNWYRLRWSSRRTTESTRLFCFPKAWEHKETRLYSNKAVTTIHQPVSVFVLFHFYLFKSQGIFFFVCIFFFSFLSCFSITIIERKAKRNKCCCCYAEKETRNSCTVRNQKNMCFTRNSQLHVE